MSDDDELLDSDIAFSVFLAQLDVPAVLRQAQDRLQGEEKTRMMVLRLAAERRQHG